MLELTYSNQTEALLACLTRRIREARAAGKGPWEPIHLVAPNPYFKEYLRQGLARELGVAANLQFSYLDGLWKDLLVDEGRRLLAFDLLRAGLLQALGDRDLLAQPVMKPVGDYLGHEDGLRKRVQLASELAKLFEEYQLSRPEWIEAWRQGKPGGTPDDAQEAWQSRLWLAAVRALDGAADGGRKVTHLTLLELIRSSRFEGMKMPRALHAFGLTHVAQVYQEVFQAFVPLPDTTLHIYALNPCGEFWEDLDTGRQALWTDLPAREQARLGPWDEKTEDFYELASRGPAALRLWGRPGREKIRLLNEVSECDFTPAFVVPAAATLLGRVQRDILLYRDPSGDPGRADGSVRCMACPSPRREAEIVATEVWRLMEEHRAAGDPLSFSDLAVVVPPGDEEASLAHLQAAFHDAHQIPLIRGPRAFPVMRQILEAVELLLELPTSGLTRAALLRVLQHPGLRRRLGDVDASAWGRWCEAFGIVRGADRAAWEDSYLEPDALNWDQGLRRLVLGEFMAEGEAFRQGAELYAVDGAREEAAAAVFIAFVRGLCADAKELLDLRDDPRAWARRIRQYLERWLEVDEGEEAEAVLRSLDRIRTYLERMFERVPSDLDLPRIEFAAARDLALEALERLKGEQSANLTKGVVVATYATMRAIPFRAIFLMGNGEGRFPTRDRVSALDLRKKARRPGDVSQVEKEKYLFLELLLSARDHLVLTYVGLDELSGEPLEPSGLFKEFRQLLEAYLAPETPAEPLVAVHPLRRFDPAYFPTVFGGAAAGQRLFSHSGIALREAVALRLGDRARAQGAVLPGTLGELSPEPLRDEVRAALDAPVVPEAGTPRKVIRITLGELRTFLECPLSGAAAVRLGLRKRDLEDRSAVEDELFTTDALGQWALRQETALEALDDPSSDVDQVYDACLARHQARGEAPFGLFSDVERDANVARVKGWVDHLRSMGAPRPETWRLGTNRSRTRTVDHPEPPVAIDLTLHGRPCRVELTGDLKVQLDGSLSLEGGQVPIKSKLPDFRKKALAAYLDHLALACLGDGHGEHAARFVFETKKKPQGMKVLCQELRYRFPAVDRATAQARFRGWLEDLLANDHAVLLPIEAVLDGLSRNDLTPESIRTFLENELDKDFSSVSTLKGPVPEPLRFDPPPDPMGLAMARLKPFLDVVQQPEEMV